MTKSKQTKDETTTSTEDKVNQPANAIIAPSLSQTTPSNEVASHQYQANSPAINTNVLAGYAAEANSYLDALQTPEKEQADKEAAELKEKQELANLEVKKAQAGLLQGVPVSAKDYDYRTTLDVSHPLYRNPSLDHK